MAHIAAVNDVRLPVAQRRPRAVWVCERELSARPLPGAPALRAHRPDAVVRAEGGRRVAVEVELTLKSRARIERIVGQLLSGFDAVWCFAAPAPAPAPPTATPAGTSSTRASRPRRWRARPPR